MSSAVVSHLFYFILFTLAAGSPIHCRSVTARLYNPSTLPLPPPAGASIASPHIYPSTAPSSSAYSSSAAAVPYFNSSGETAWSSPAVASSLLSTLNLGFLSIEAAPYYRYCASLSDSTEDPFEQVPNYKGYPGAYGIVDAEEGRPSRGSWVASSWMDASPSCKMSLPSKKKRLLIRHALHLWTSTGIFAYIMGLQSPFCIAST